MALLFNSFLSNFLFELDDPWKITIFKFGNYQLEWDIQLVVTLLEGYQIVLLACFSAINEKEPTAKYIFL